MIRGSLMIILLGLLVTCTQRSYSDREQFRAQFQNPALSNRPMVYWFWNGAIEHEEIRRQLLEMKNSGTVSAACILGWEGLGLEYLSEEWFDKVAYACQVAAEIGLDIWLYDELRWPSGHAGGKVLDGFPQYQAKCLRRTELRVTKPGPVVIEGDSLTVAVLTWPEGSSGSDSAVIDLMSLSRNDSIVWQAPGGNWLIQIFEMEACKFTTTFTDLKYVDLLDSAAVQRFVTLTYDAYYERMPQYFGSVIKAIITDEPGLYCDLKPFLLNPGSLPWSSALLAEFQQRKGYDLRRHLPALWQDSGPDAYRIRVDFYGVLADLLQDNYFRVLHDWCERHGIQLNLQPSHEETLKYAVKLMGDYFKAMQYSHLPGVDEVYAWDKHNIVPKIGSSAARAFGSQNVWAEVFAAYGWEISLETMKAVTDWLFSRGINHLMLSAFYFSMEGEWRFEIPPSLFFQNPFWPYLPHYTDYVSRLQVLLSDGRNVAPVAVLYPTRTAQALMTPADEAPLDSLDQALQEVSNALLRHPIDFDYVDERTLLNKLFIVKQEAGTVLRRENDQFYTDYEVLILPRVTVMDSAVLAKIARFHRQGGKVIAFERLPHWSIEGEPLNDAVAAIWSRVDKDSSANHSAWFIGSGADSLLRLLEQIIIPDVHFDPPLKTVNYIHKEKAGWHIYFISNHDSLAVDARVSFARRGRPQIWEAQNGSIDYARTFQQVNGRTRMPLHLPPYGSLLVVFDVKDDYAGPMIESNTEIVAVNIQGDTLIVESYPQQDGLSQVTVFRQNREWRREWQAPPPLMIETDSVWDFQALDGSIVPEKRRPGTWTEGQIFDVDGRTYRAAAHPHFSGTAIYRQTIWLDSTVFEEGRRFILQTANVKNVMEVRVNGQIVGVRCWPPFELDISPFLKTAANELEIRVTNTLANAYAGCPNPYTTGENWGKVLDSGLMEAVRIVGYDRQKVIFQD
jgi:hypothetical protein